MEADKSRYGLIGEKLGHSYSKIIHEMLGYGYDLWEIRPDELSGFMKKADFDGINVTIPYKKAVMEYLDEVSEEALRIGAVNTVYKKDGRLIGTNTDYTGLRYAAARAGIDLKGRKVLVLGGTGGAGGMACTLAEDEGAGQVFVASRRAPEEKADAAGRVTVTYDDIPSDIDVIINASPVGMYPLTDGSLVEPADFPGLEGVIDLIYNPLRTKLVRRAEALGIRASGGLAMLVRQATDAAGYFRGEDFSSRTEDILRRIELETENIVLIGMPGCGKSSIGRRVARRLGRRFVDTDMAVKEKTGRHPSDIIREDGEAAFRDIEQEVIEETAREHSLVIATGGGAVKREANSDALRMNGRLFFIKRDPAKLSTKGRPLSQGSDLRKMYAERRPMYEAAADVIIQNEGRSFEPAVRRIAKRYRDTE